MRTINTLYVPLALFVSSCTNALYFYETDKISLTAEVRPDSTQPVQGNFGLKQRVALITPEQDEGDALSVISSFRFDVIPVTGFNFNPIRIRTALITGKAASCLNKTQVAEAAKAISLEGQLQRQDKAISAITKSTKDKSAKLSQEKLTNVFRCFGYPDTRARELAKRYQGLTSEEFKKAFKSDYRFEAPKMLRQYSRCTDSRRLQPCA